MYSFHKVDVYGSKQVMGIGTAKPGTPYSVKFMFHGMGGASYLAALSHSQRLGIAFGSRMLNLAPDDLFRATLQGALVQGFVGMLSQWGTAAGTISIPANAPPGLTFFCSAVSL